MTITVDFVECFQCFKFETSFLKSKNFEKIEYHFLVESTTIASTTLPFKTDLSKANTKTSRIWEYKVDLSQRMQFQHYLLDVFKKINFSARTT